MRGWVEKRGENSFRLCVYLGKQADGTYKTERKSVKCDSREEAEVLLGEFITDLRRGDYIKSPNETLKEFMEKWLEKVVKVDNQPNTYRTYSEMCKYHIFKHNISAMKLGDIKTIHAEEFLRSLKGSVKNVRITLSSALGYAAAMKLIKENPCTGIRLKKSKKNKKLTVNDVWNREQVKKFLDHIDGEFYGYYFALILATGMRQNEAFALSWDKINGNNILIDSAVKARKSNHDFIIGSIKTDNQAGVRTVPITNEDLQRLQKHKKEQAEYQLSCGEEYFRHNLVITDTSGGVPCQRHIRRVMIRICERAEVPYIPPMNLRHTHATLLLAAGVHPKVVSERLGHSDIRLTLNTYSFALEGMQQEAKEKLERYMNGTKKKTFKIVQPKFNPTDNRSKIEKFSS